MQPVRPIRVLFICMGNICRSPMAEAVFRHHVAAAGLSDQLLIDSAGTGGWHAGDCPHPGTLAVLERKGIAVGDQRARRVVAADLRDFDYLIAMDKENLADLAQFDREGARRARLLLEFAPDLAVREVPDPFYSGGFDHVFQLVEAGSHGLLAHIREREGL